MSQEKSKILVVDDEPGMRDFLEIMLQKEGYIVETAPDGLRSRIQMGTAR